MSDYQPPDAIQWHEGMLLAPQHFQQLALRQEVLLDYHMRLAQPYHWGIRRLEVDNSLLLDGTFRVNELEAVMPDALLAFHPSGEGELEIDLTPYLDDISAGPMTIHLVVPAQKSDTPAKGDLARYESAEGTAVPDLNTGGDDMRIPRLRPRIGLLVGDKPSEKYINFPLAEVEIRNEALVLSDFMPPALGVTQSSVLGKRCLILAQRLREKAVFLSERLLSPSASSGDPMVIETQGLIRAIVAGLPQFEAVINSGVTHPFPVYLSLCSLIGHLAAVGGGFVPPALPPYNHNDLRGTFNRALDFALRMIDSVREAYVAVPFGRDEGGFQLRLEKPWIGRRLVIGVRARPDQNAEQARGWIESSLIGSGNRIESLEERRILGAARTEIEKDDELGLMPVRGVVLFAIEPDPAFIEAEQTLMLLNRADPRGEAAPASVTLYVANAGVTA